MAAEHQEETSRSKEELEREMASARANLVASAAQLRDAVSLRASPRYQLRQHPGIALGVAAATGLVVAWLVRGTRRRTRERRVLDAIVRHRKQRHLSWWERLQRAYT